MAPTLPLSHKEVSMDASTAPARRDAIEKTVTLKDGKAVTIRRMRPEDVERSSAFFCALPPEDRVYLRTDVIRRDLVERRTRELDLQRTERVVVVFGDEIVGDGTLEVQGHGWGDGVAEVRLIVARPWQRLGLGTVIARELFHLASRRRIDRVVARLMRPQVGAHRILRRLGFNEEFLIPEHVPDQDGTWQDLIIMRCSLEELWRDIEYELTTGDFQRHR
jgi:RimJ/RimL family protein N-acetyltransferase